MWMMLCREGRECWDERKDFAKGGTGDGDLALVQRGPFVVCMVHLHVTRTGTGL